MNQAPDPPRPERAPVLIDRPEPFERMMHLVRFAPLIGVDTEADSFHSYREKVCLVQISTADEDFLVDPLGKNVPMHALGEVFADEGQIKIFHDGEFDIGILKRDFDFEFRSVFDTRIALSLMGCPRPGLANVLQERFGIELDKTHQRSDWSARPLSEAQRHYARMDSRYLIPLQYQLRDELVQCGRLEAHAAACRRLERMPPKIREEDPEAWKRIRGWRELDPRGRRFLIDLHAWREDLAERRDEPPFRVLPNGVLLMLARRASREVDRPAQAVDRLSARHRQIHRKRLADVLEASARRPPWVEPRRPPSRDPRSAREIDALKLAGERLKAWRRDKAEFENMDPAYVLSRGTLAHLAHALPVSLAELRRSPDLEDWQFREFGDELVALCRDLRHASDGG